MNHGCVGGDLRFITVADAGDGDARFEAAGDRVEADAFEVRIRDNEGVAFQGSSGRATIKSRQAALT